MKFNTIYINSDGIPCVSTVMTGNVPIQPHDYPIVKKLLGNIDVFPVLKANIHHELHNCYGFEISCKYACDDCCCNPQKCGRECIIRNR